MPLASVLSMLLLLATEPIRWTAPVTNEMSDLSAFLEPFRKKLALPALAAAVVQDQHLVAAGAVGERKYGSGISVTLEDKFHIGSCTKSMTALLAVDAARSGKIKFDTPVAEVFSDWTPEKEKASITLELLLQNRSGLPGKAPPELWWRAVHQISGSPREQRKIFLREMFAEPLQAKPGEKYIYSNMGFALAGAMLEEKLDQPWEDLMRERIFAPLGLKSAGFGAPAKDEQVDQPWGHQMREDKIIPLAQRDNPAAIAPAGLVHMSVLDIARYAAFHCDAFNGKIPELKEYRDRMYTAPAGSNYAYGWFVTKRDWGGGTVLNHNGSNTMYYTVIWIAPLKGFSFVVTTNMGDKDGGANPIAEKCDQVVAALIKKFI
jgi:CubicO group peptidase (beta-lactamase class C family)